MPTLPQSPRAGFTLVEVIVVTIVIGLLLVLGSHVVWSSKRNSREGELAAATNHLWNTVQGYRADHSSKLPPTLAEGAGGLRVAGTDRYYYQHWPEAEGTPVAVVASGAASPPITIPPALTGTVMYGRACSGACGFLVAYSRRGTQIFRRHVGTATALEPIG